MRKFCGGGCRTACGHSDYRGVDKAPFRYGSFSLYGPGKVRRAEHSPRRSPLGHYQPASRLLVATDLTERSDLAVQRGLQMADKLGAELRVLHVVDAGLPRRVALRRLNEARSVIQEQLGLLADPSLRNVSISVKIGDAHLEIIREAIEHTSGAIVVVPRRRSRAEDQGMVPTSARILRYASRPILLVRDVPAAPYKNALVEVDLTATSPHVVAAVRRLAPSAAVRLVHVYPGDEPEFSGAVPNAESRAARLRRVHSFLDLLPGMPAEAGEADICASTILAKGSVLDAIATSSTRPTDSWRRCIGCRSGIT
jgi:nucleotide-binding universal stress UspA family protein